MIYREKSRVDSSSRIEHRTFLHFSARSRRTTSPNCFPPQRLNDYGYFDAKKVTRLLKKIAAGRAIGNTDNMALVGILSTQIWHHLFVEHFHQQIVGSFWRN